MTFCSDTSSLTCLRLKGSIRLVFTMSIRIEHPNQANVSTFGPREIPVLAELTLGRPRHHLTDVKLQPKSTSGNAFRTN